MSVARLRRDQMKIERPLRMRKRILPRPTTAFANPSSFYPLYNKHLRYELEGKKAAILLQHFSVEDDIQFLVNQTNASWEVARATLQRCGGLLSIALRTIRTNEARTAHPDYDTIIALCLQLVKQLDTVPTQEQLSAIIMACSKGQASLQTIEKILVKTERARKEK